MDASKAASMGIATHNEEERVAAALGKLQEVSIQFDSSIEVCKAGVLFAYPALISQGLLKAFETYQSLKKGYYGLKQIVVLLAFMALCRIKNPEQLKKCAPGELGKIMGIDRVPEVKTLRKKLKEIFAQGKAVDFSSALTRRWLEEENETHFFFYVDGHVRVYSGHQATLTKKYVSRQKLCLAGTTEYWVNNQMGMPYLVVFAELNEKLKEALEKQVIPRLLEDTRHLIDHDQLKSDPDLPLFTLIFDREAYEPKFFKKLWDEHRIAVLTYRKNVQDKWNEKEFKTQQASVIGKIVSMQICEKEVSLDNVKMREVRKLGKEGHQTSIITTNKKISTALIAGKMFSRWAQENFFRYMIQDYDIDNIIEYGVEEIVPQKSIVNPTYKQLTYQIKKLREKKGRIEAKLYQIMTENMDKSIDHLKASLDKEADLLESIQWYDADIKQKIEERKNQPTHITLEDIDQTHRPNKLKTESKQFINTIKMVAYRAETALCNLLRPYWSTAEKDIRMLVKEIINSDADIHVDYENKVLTITLHSLSTPRANQVVKKLCELLNQTQTNYLCTEWKLFYKTLAN
jgi:hypothetical protein